MVTGAESAASSSESNRFAAFGRPEGLPDWPGLNRVALGGWR